MDTHAAPTPRRRTFTRLKRVVLLVAVPSLVVFALFYIVNSLKVSDATKRLRNPDPRVRLAAINELGEMGSSASSAIPTLLDVMRNDDSREVSNAVPEVLWKIGPDTNAGNVWLNSRLKDPDAAVRTHAAFVLGSHRPHWSLAFLRLRRPWVKEAVTALAEVVRDEDRVVRWMAVTGIMRYAGPDTAEAVPALVQAMDDDSEVIRRHAAIALTRIGPAAHPAIPALVREIKKPYEKAGEEDPDRVWVRAHMVKLHAGMALGRIGPRAVPELVKLLEDPDDGVREMALHAFPYVGKEALPRLAELLRDPNVVTRRSAAQAVGSFGAAAAGMVPSLMSALQDADEEVRDKAAFALGRIGPAASPAVPALAASLKDTDKVYSICYALGEIGPEAKEAVPALLAFIGDENRPDYARAHAINTLLKIAPEAQASVPPHLLEEARQVKKDEEELYERMAKTPTTDVNPMYR